ncbi:hypothetical protein WJX84_011686 [Apatococcus fuscideae]|uniref:AAA+ ATPase domain-containing protein n=1 Tax=Apatococcus fuscideae TaxID=2026836 RepID=A0AAW1TFN9_9CHLO
MADSAQRGPFPELVASHQQPAHFCCPSARQKQFRQVSVQSKACSDNDDGPHMREGPASSGNFHGRPPDIDPEMLAKAMAIAPFAAISLDRFKDIGKSARKLYDRIYYGEVLPPVGAAEMSYARLLEHLENKTVKRIVLLADSRYALVETVQDGWASDPTVFPKRDREFPELTMGTQLPEWKMEKQRFYVELPGDMYSDGHFMNRIKGNQIIKDRDSRLSYEDMLLEHQVTTELQVVDPNDSSVFLNETLGELLPFVFIFALRLFVEIGRFVLDKLNPRKKDRMQEIAEELGHHRAKEYNVGEMGRDTGVRYEDVAGIEHVKQDITDTMEMLTNKNPEFEGMGARPPRGILMVGPPGTGKTLLAKALAGEGNVPFFSANGAEFVEMYAGIAAARIRDLFLSARRIAPAIIFIDEIDAIGRARGLGMGDAGQTEREQGLLQMLVEMDGFRRNDRVLVIGATNRISMLDDALLRPGRFDKVIYMGRPPMRDRLKILQVHAEGKSLDRSGNSEYETDALLSQTAAITIGYSGAELENLLNEAAILTVRYGDDSINMSHIVEAMDKAKLGLATTRMADSPAKRRMATVIAGQAVVAALTPGMPQLEAVSIAPRGNVPARLDFKPQEALGWARRLYPEEGKTLKVNAVEITEPPTLLELCAGMLMPQYAARATEEALYGRRGVTITTGQGVAIAGRLAYWLVAHSNLDPRFNRTPMGQGMQLGGRPDPVTARSTPRFEAAVVRLQQAAYIRTLRLVQARRAAIEQIAEELCQGRETVRGDRVVEIIETCKLEPARPAIPDEAVGAFSQHFQTQAGQPGTAAFAQADGRGRSGSAGMRPQPSPMDEVWSSVDISDDMLRVAAEAVVGRVDIEELLGDTLPKYLADELKEQLDDREVAQRLSYAQSFAKSSRATSDLDFPPPPSVLPQYKGTGLGSWMPAEPEVISVAG